MVPTVLPPSLSVRWIATASEYIPTSLMLLAVCSLCFFSDIMKFCPKAIMREGNAEGLSCCLFVQIKTTLLSSSFHVPQKPQPSIGADDLSTPLFNRPCYSHQWFDIQPRQPSYSSLFATLAGHQLNYNNSYGSEIDGCILYCSQKIESTLSVYTFSLGVAAYDIF